MEAISCPNCGYGSCVQVDDSRWSCPACDSIFNVHNLSKEFQATDEHITMMHQDLKTSINKIGNIERMADRNYLDEAGTLQKAEVHLRNGDNATALEFFSEVAEEYPDHYEGWYGRFRAMTGDFSQVERYAIFLCGGLPDEFDKENCAQGASFLGSDDVRKALMCENADQETIVSEVSDFLFRSAEYGKKEAEEGVLEIREGNKELTELRKNYLRVARGGKGKEIAVALLPVLFVVAVIGLIVLYLTKLEEKGDVILVGVVALILLFIFRRKIFGIIGRGAANAKKSNAEWNEALSEKMEELVSAMGSQIRALKAFCCDIDNYNYIMSSIHEDPYQYMEEYISDPLKNMIDEDESDTAEDEAFAADFFAGNIERFRYLSGIDEAAGIEQNTKPRSGKSYMGVKATSVVGYLGFPGFLIAYFLGAKEGADFYLNQALIYNIAATIAQLLLGIFGYIGVLVGYVFSMVFFIIGVVYAVKQQPKELPLIGRFRILKNSDAPKAAGKVGEAESSRGSVSSGRKCPKCGADLDEDSIFCGSCGAKIG